jgi:2-polyprenyl-3-methyl-5-hydroxy-6-metoxy-1,4-benzoquinol methylase
MPPSMIDLTHQPCPICGQTTSQIVHETTYPEHHYPGKFILRRCDGCGLLFNSPRLDSTELGRLYGRNYYFFLRKYSREFDRIVAMYQRTIGLLDLSQIEKRSIDIGCGRGYFPAILKKLGWNASGIEISSDAADYARTKFGLDVFTGTVEQYASSAGAKQFPVVTAIDVIEHVPSLTDFVSSAAKLVEPGGRLIIDTPNGSAHNIAVKGVRWKGFNPFHIYLLSIENLTKLLAQCGLTMEQSLSYGNVPADQDEPVVAKLRDRTVAGLKKFGLLGPAVSAYFGLKKLTMSKSDNPESHVESAVARIRSEASYTGTADSTAPLAGSKTGDNIVVVARKG